MQGSRDWKWNGPGGGCAEVIGYEPPAQLLGTQQQPPGNPADKSQTETAQKNLKGGGKKQEANSRTDAGSIVSDEQGGA